MKINHIPISLYIHIPWCLHKCPYCDFNSHKLTHSLPEETYVSTLITDFKEQCSNLQNRTIQTIFIGGGTPSLFSPDAYHHLLRTLQTLSNFDHNIEITLEANPGTIEQGYFNAYRQAGINRLSIGVQSFQNDKLKILQRIHDANEAKRAIDAAYQAGFKNVNIDLMFGLPNQTIDDGLYDLQTAIDLNPTHLSWYQLTLEPHTPFYHQPPKLPKDEGIWELQIQGQRLLKAADYQQYEVSAYAKDNRLCQHNRNYWLFGDYIGIGAGAHGKITDFKNQIIYRHWNRKNPNDYSNPKTPMLRGKKIISNDERPLEFMMNALRLHEAIPTTLFEDRTGLALSVIEAPLKTAENENFLLRNKATLQLTNKGQRFLNELLMLF